VVGRRNKFQQAEFGGGVMPLWTKNLENEVSKIILF